MPFEITETGDDAFVLSQGQPQHIDLQKVLALTQQTTVNLFTSAEAPGVSIWAVDPANAQALSQGAAFQGTLLNPQGQFGFTTVTLPAGNWLFGATFTGSQPTHAFIDASTISLPGVPTAGNVPMAAVGNPGAWRAVGFTVSDHPQGFIETEATGGLFAIMTDDQFRAFQIQFPHGYVGGDIAFVAAAGAPATHLQTGVILPAGNYHIVWINDTGGWAGGAANVSFFGNITGTAGAAFTGAGRPNGAGANFFTDTPSSDNDRLVATPAFAEIHAGAGNDTITGASVRDYLRGDDGDDSIQGGSAFDDINGNKGGDTIDGGSGGGDWLVGGQGNDLITAHRSDNILYGNLGNDTLIGGNGSDLLRGGQGDDSIVGGAGNSFISGDRGDDTESGGAGADIFHTSQDAGIDRVLDFNLAEGDRVMLDPGTTYALAQAGADTVITMGPGHQMILVGVDLATLTSGWIFGA